MKTKKINRRSFFRLSATAGAAAAIAPALPLSPERLQASEVPEYEPESDPMLDESRGIVGIAAHDGQLIAIGHGGELITSPDGITWTERGKIKK